MHSPPRATTVKDQQDWKIPPCISNWKNPKVIAHPSPLSQNPSVQTDTNGRAWYFNEKVL